jgi:hypothetical protein
MSYERIYPLSASRMRVGRTDAPVVEAAADGEHEISFDPSFWKRVTGGAGSRNLVLEAIDSLPGSRFTSRPMH